MDQKEISKIVFRPNFFEIGLFGLVCVQGTDGNIGPSVTIWAGFDYAGNSELVVLDGTMDQQVYRRVLQQSLLPWTRVTCPTSP